jgi:hypothetical protein
MSHRTTADPQVHLHWVRETPSRALNLPVSISLPSLESLPPCVQSAVRALPFDTVELHLPPYRPSRARDFEAWSAGLQFRQDAVGRLIATHAGDPDPLATMAYHQAMVLVLRAVSGDTTPLTIVAEPPVSPLLQRPLARRHRCSGNGGLAKAPAERSFGYDRSYKGLSAAIQIAVRQAVPPAHISSIGQFADRDHTLALLTWGAAVPAVGRNVDELGVEVLKPSLLNTAFRGLYKNLGPRLEDVREILIRHGAKPALCDRYKPSKAVPIADGCRRRPRFLNLLFSNEHRLISAFVQFCARIAGWRTRAAGDPTVVFREVREAWENLEIHIRSFYQRQPHSVLGSILLVEAVRALEAVDLEN